MSVKFKCTWSRGTYLVIYGAPDSRNGDSKLHTETYQVVERNYRYNRYMYYLNHTKCQMGGQPRRIPPPKYFKQRSRVFKFPNKRNTILCFSCTSVMKLNPIASAVLRCRAVVIPDDYK